MKDINATIIIELEGKSEEEVFKTIKYSRRKSIKIAKKSKLYFEQANSEQDLEEMYKLHSTILREGGTTPWKYDKWRKYVSLAADKFYFMKKGNTIIGCFALSEITEREFGINSDKKGIRPLVFANYKEFNNYKPNDFMYWCSIKYALNNSYSFIDLGGYQIKPRGHLKGINFFKEGWGGKIFYYYLDYSFLKAIGRKLIRNIGFFWWVNAFLKKLFLMPPQGVEPRSLPCKRSVLTLHHGSN